MVTTRAATKQTKVDDFAEGKTLPTKTSRTKAKTKEGGKASAKSSKESESKDYARKRKSPPTTTSKSSSTPKPKCTKTKDESTGSTQEGVVIINRAPVLHLWGACLAHFLHPELSWPTCLSIGQAISTICAISKGRSIGTIEKPEDTEERKRKKEQQRKEVQELEEVEVMRFHLRMKDGSVILSGKPVSSSENGLRGKFGEMYDGVKEAMSEALQSWRGDEEELSRRGFGMYENFRPSVMKGQGGWGRKGELRLETIESVVRKS